MSLTTNVKDKLNKVLGMVNLKVDTLTADNVEFDRIRRQIAIGHFMKPVFPLLDGMVGFDTGPLAKTFMNYSADIEKLVQGFPPGYFNPSNKFYSTPDAEILYLMVRTLMPKRIVEIGSGNSTRIIRQAIFDSGLQVQHIAIDPAPRIDITGLVDSVHRTRFEEIDAIDELVALESNDILFIDSSHQVRVASDVVKLFCNVIPTLNAGVVVHVHDIFLPFDYPEPFCTDFSGWGEQYLLQILLASQPHEILWPGYFAQRMLPEAREALPFLSGGTAQSFWFKL